MFAEVKMLQEFRECSRFHLFHLKLATMIMLRLVPIEWNEGIMNQFKLLIQPYPREKKESMSVEWKKKKKGKKREIFKDDIRSLDGLKTERYLARLGKPKQKIWDHTWRQRRLPTKKVASSLWTTSKPLRVSAKMMATGFSLPKFLTT